MIPMIELFYEHGRFECLSSGWRETRDSQISKFVNYDESCTDETGCRNAVVAREACCSIIVDKIRFPVDFQET